MIRSTKQMILALSVIGLTIGAYASDDVKPKGTNASNLEVALATAGVAVGAGVATAGVMPIIAPVVIESMGLLSTETAEILASAGIDNFLFIPGGLLALFAAKYLYDVAKDSKSKTKTIIGSVITAAGAAALTAGFALKGSTLFTLGLGAALSGNTGVKILATVNESLNWMGALAYMGGASVLLGYAIQPKAEDTNPA